MSRKRSEVEPVFTDVQKAEIQKRLKEQQEERERLRREGVKSLFRVKLGVHAGCGGSLEYKQLSTRYGSRITGRTKIEEPTCRCEKCGAMFDPEFPLYRKKIEKAARKEEA